nr:YbhB/YbcL family Raf kinase inhibitor-like protein [Oharaeibacter diazotrophicus]
MRPLLSLAALVVGAATSVHAADFTVTSPDFTDGGRLGEAQVFDGFGCTGGNVAPALAWTGAPAGTKSFAVTVYDPDAPTGSGFWHWSMFDIPAATTSLATGSTGAGRPAGAVEVRNDYGGTGFGGACPPPGPAHRYVVTVFALKVDKLGLGADATPAVTGFMLNANVLATARITALYGR